MASMIGNLVTSEGRTCVSTIITRRLANSLILDPSVWLRLGQSCHRCPTVATGLQFVFMDLAGGLARRSRFLRYLRLPSNGLFAQLAELG